MIHGKRDLVVPFEGVVSTGAKAKYFDIWEEGAHMIPIENTKKYVDSILKFLS
jgi:pimeloyl-ACP methyl ester carboxylesterase